MTKLEKIRRGRIDPDEFCKIMEELGITDEQFRDLFNRGHLEIEGYRTGLRKDGKPHTPPTVAEALVLDYLREHPDTLQEFLRIAREDMIRETDDA